jgi:hypothetical protein
LEYCEGKGVVLFCEVDVTGRTESDPGAIREPRRSFTTSFNTSRRGMIRIASSTGDGTTWGVERYHPRSSPRNAECQQPETIRARTEVLAAR